MSLAAVGQAYQASAESATVSRVYCQSVRGGSVMPLGAFRGTYTYRNHDNCSGEGLDDSHSNHQSTCNNTRNSTRNSTRKSSFKRSVKRSAYSYGLGLLARREYSQQALMQKMMHRGYSVAETKRAVSVLGDEGWLDDYRYAQQLCHRLIERGYGPIYIRQIWRQNGISPDLKPRELAGAAQKMADQLSEFFRGDEACPKPNLSALLASYDELFWLERAQNLVRQFVKARWGCSPDQDQRVFRRAYALLHRRGFSSACIKSVLGESPSERIT